MQAISEDIETWTEVGDSKEFAPTYHEALPTGPLPLQGLTRGLEVGPCEAPPEQLRSAKPGGLFGIWLGATVRR